jgi:hypothetical protein
MTLDISTTEGQGKKVALKYWAPITQYAAPHSRRTKTSTAPLHITLDTVIFAGVIR